jgi:hypothetical protein
VDWVGPFPRVKGRSDFRQEPLFEDLTQPSVAMGLSLRPLGYRGRVVYSRPDYPAPLVPVLRLAACWRFRIRGSAARPAGRLITTPGSRYRHECQHDRLQKFQEFRPSRRGVLAVRSNLHSTRELFQCCARRLPAYVLRRGITSREPSPQELSEIPAKRNLSVWAGIH